MSHRLWKTIEIWRESPRTSASQLAQPSPSLALRPTRVYNVENVKACQKGGMIVDIKIYGHGCDKCEKMYALVLEILAEHDLHAEVEKVESLMEIYKAGVMTTPAMSIDGTVVYAANAVPGRGSLEALLLQKSK